MQRLNRPIIALLAVAAIAGGVRFWELSRPTSLVFDEYYYPKAGCIFIGWSNKQCQIQSSDEKYWRNAKWDVGSWVHPPLGKWEIGLGIKAFGTADANFKPDYSKLAPELQKTPAVITRHRLPRDTDDRLAPTLHHTVEPVRLPFEIAA